jgi:hypothetical protein
MCVMLKRFALATAALFVIAGCAGDASVTPSRFQGSYTGTWVNVADATDAGTSTWHVDSTGNVTGQDHDAGDAIIYSLSGQLDNEGNLTSLSTPNNGDPTASLNGPMQINNQGQLTGLLVWGVEPPLTYSYTLTRN